MRKGMTEGMLQIILAIAILLIFILIAYAVSTGAIKNLILAVMKYK